jgi:TolB-like protein/DNA-binding winged helix-turn-helix (wHTH) protein
LLNVLNFGRDKVKPQAGLRVITGLARGRGETWGHGGARSTGDIFLFEGFRLDRRAGGLFRLDGRGPLVPVVIGSRALDVLGVLVKRHGDLVSKDEIMAAVWPGTVVEDNNLTVQISALRRTLDRGRSGASCIQTVAGRGYRFVGPVTRREVEVPSSSPAIIGNGADCIEEGRTSEMVVPCQPTAVLEGRGAPHRRWLERGVMAMIIAVALFLGDLVIDRNWDDGWISKVARSPPHLSIVVMPSSNLSNDPDQEYFADSITDDLTTDLSRLVGSFVIARSTAFTYKGKAVGAKQIGHELGVRYVLEGSVRRSGNQLRVNAQLIDAETNAHLWAERFDRDTSDLFALQNEITTRIAVALNQELISAAAARPTEQPDALDYILRGRAALYKLPSRYSYAEAVRLFERALDLDPRSVDAQSWLAGALAGRILENMSDSVVADLTRAEALITQALAASPSSPLVHLHKAQLLRYQHQCDEAIPEYEAAIAFNRNWVFAIAALGWCKFLNGSIGELIPTQEQALRLSPRDRNTATWFNRIGVVHLLQSRTDEAISWFEKARGANPLHPRHHAHLASAYALKGEAGPAAAELAEARRLGDSRWSSVTRLRATEYFGVPKIQDMYEATYITGLRKAGMPEE